MRIQLISDLHLEHERESDGDSDPYGYEFPADPTVDALALVGDVGQTNDDRFYAYLRAQLARFKVVLFVPGNHEAHFSSLVRLFLLPAGNHRQRD